MALPNMAMIPSGYKPTKLYSVLPTETLGGDVITNGDFSNGSTNWIIEAAWTIAGGVANGNGANGTAQELVQAGALVNGTTYILKYEVKNYVSGFVRTRGPSTPQRSANGVYTTTIVASGPLTFLGGNFNGSITNISAKEVLVGDADFDVTRATPATRVNQQGLIETPEFIESGELITNGDFSNGATDWTLESGWSVSGSTANTDGTVNKNIKQNNVTTIGKQYKYSFDVLNSSVGDVRGRFRNNNDSVLNFFGDGTYSGYFTATNTSINIVVLSTNTATFSIDNISIIEVERNNIPRLDYTDGTCPVLLTEPLSTNLITYSQDISNASWLKQNSGIASIPNVTANYAISPDGTKNASRVVFDLNEGTTSSDFSQLQSEFTGTSGAVYTSSVYMKSNNNNNYNVTVVGVNGGTNERVVTKNWQRFEITAALSSSNFRIRTRPTENSSDVTDILIWGAQVENLPYSTSYIPTIGTAVTRNKDIVDNAGTSATYNSVEGVLFVDVAVLVNQVVNKRITISDGTDANRILINISADQISGFVNVNSATQYTFFEGSQSVLNLNKIAIKYKQNDFAVWINGVQYDVSTSGTTFPLNTLTTLSFDNGSSGEFFFGKTSQVQVFNTALSDFDLQNLTSNATSYASYETMRTSLNFNIQ